MQNTKRYWLKGLIIGVVFGFLVVYAHENVSEFGHIFGINYDGVHAPLWFSLYIGFIQVLYSISFIPFFFLGILIMLTQFFLPPITYGVFGMMLGWAYGKFNKKVMTYMIVFIVALIIFIPIWIYLLQTVARSQWDSQNYIDRVDTYL